MSSSQTAEEVAAAPPLDEGIQLLQALSKEELIRIIVDDAKNWLAHDGLWFQAVDVITSYSIHYTKLYE